MKRIVCFLLTAVLVVSLVGCGGEAGDNPNVGTWIGVSVDVFGIEGNINEVYAGGSTLELKADGGCTAVFDGDRATGKWTGSGSRLTVTIGGADYKCEIDGDALILELLDEMNVIYTKTGRMPVNRVSSSTTSIDDGDVPTNGSILFGSAGGSENAADEPGEDGPIATEPMDEAHNGEQSGDAGLAAGYAAEIIGKWLVADGYEWHDWFIGGEVVEFFEGGIGVESLDGSSWHFTWSLEVGLEMNYNADEPYEMQMIILSMEYEQNELRFYLYDNDGSVLWDSQLILDQGAGPPLVLERWQ